jgi:TAK1-binding protein 1
MPLEPKGSDDWVSSGSSCPDTSVSSLPSKSLFGDNSHPIEDRYATDVRGDVLLYLVLDGHEGAKASNFVNKHLPERVLSYKLTGGSHDSILGMLHEAFIITDRRFFEDMEPLLAHKGVIQSDLKECTSAEAQTQFPRHVERLQEIEDAIRGGATGTLAVIIDKGLYIANIGNCRALLCTLDGNGTLTVTQVTDDHNVKTELPRLESVGLSKGSLARSGCLGPYESTRSFGDYQLKHGYSDIDFLKSATRPPGISDPKITGPFLLDEMSNSFLIVMSGGLLTSLMKLNSSVDYDANEIIARMVTEELCACKNFKDVSRKVLDRVHRQIEDLCKRDDTRSRDLGTVDDLTLLIRNFGFPVGEQTSLPLAYILSVSCEVSEKVRYYTCLVLYQHSSVNVCYSHHVIKWYMTS